MPYLLSIENHTTSRNFRVSGKTKLDAFIFTQDPRNHNRHTLLIPDKLWPAANRELFFPSQPVAIYVEYLMEPGAAEQAATKPLHDQIEKLAGELEEKTETIEQLNATLGDLQVKLLHNGQSGGGLSDAERALLKERDDMIDLLANFKESDEQPLETLFRVLLTKEAEANQAATLKALERDPEVEALAKTIYDTMRADDPEGANHPWVEGGNSTKQEEARTAARAKLNPPELPPEPIPPEARKPAQTAQAPQVKKSAWPSVASMRKMPRDRLMELAGRLEASSVVQLEDTDVQIVTKLAPLLAKKIKDEAGTK